MPTGYTAKLCQGEQSFEEFILRLSRAFGANVMLRDDPLDTPLPTKVREISPYLFNTLKDFKKELKEVENWTIKEANKKAEAHFQNELSAHLDSVKEKNILRKRLEAMITKVRAWNPPTPDHVDLQKLAISQLEETIKYDCTPYPKYPQKVSGEDFKQEKIENITWNITHYSKEIEDETKRANEANTWINTLRKSLK